RVLYLVRVRYPDGGGLTAEGRARREAVRLQAAELFAQDVAVPEIAKRLRVSHNAVYVWRRRWLTDGAAGLASRGPRGANVGCRPSSRTGWPPCCKKAPLRTATPRISGGPWHGLRI